MNQDQAQAKAQAKAQEQMSMDQVQHQLEEMEINGRTVGQLLSQLGSIIDRIRVAKLGVADPNRSKHPKHKWVVPVSAAPVIVKEAKLRSLNGKRDVGAKVDRLLLHLNFVSEAITKSQHLSYKYEVLKRIRTATDADIHADAVSRQLVQDAAVEASATSLDTAAKRKRRKVVALSDVDASSDSEFAADLR